MLRSSVTVGHMNHHLALPSLIWINLTSLPPAMR
jgi:hypothetical protein